MTWPPFLHWHCALDPLIAVWLISCLRCADLELQISGQSAWQGVHGCHQGLVPKKAGEERAKTGQLRFDHGFAAKTNCICRIDALGADGPNYEQIGLELASLVEEMTTLRNRGLPLQCQPFHGYDPAERWYQSTDWYQTEISHILLARPQVCFSSTAHICATSIGSINEQEAPTNRNYFSVGPVLGPWIFNCRELTEPWIASNVYLQEVDLYRSRLRREWRTTRGPIRPRTGRTCGQVQRSRR